MPISNRELSRKLALYALYITDLEIASALELKDFGWYEDMVHFNPEHGILDPVNEQYRESIFNFAQEIFLGVLGNLKIIDTTIEKYLVNWEFDRLRLMDKAILRIGVYCLIYCMDIPAEVTIYQANELASEYNMEDSYKYINGILHSVKKKYRRNFLLTRRKSLKLKKKKR